MLYSYALVAIILNQWPYSLNIFNAFFTIEIKETYKQTGGNNICIQSYVISYRSNINQIQRLKFTYFNIQLMKKVSRQKSNKIEEKSRKNKIQSLKTFRLSSRINNAFDYLQIKKNTQINKESVTVKWR